MLVLDELLLRPSRVATDWSGSLDYIERLARKRHYLSYRFFKPFQRDADAIANVARQNALRGTLLNKDVNSDTRFWHPAGVARPLAVSELNAGDIVAGDSKPFNPLDPERGWDETEKIIKKHIEKARRRIRWDRSTAPLSRLFFRIPSKVDICVKRKERREIMHAKGFAGYRSIGLRPKLMRWFSYVIC